MNYEFLKQLIEQAEAFTRDEATTGEPTLADFAAWMGQRFPAPPTAISVSTADHPAVETDIAVMASYLYRYTRLYGKKALAATPLATIDEFSYMVMLLEGPPPTKTELIERNIHEKTTGTEILRRLIKAGLIEQFDDPRDRRSKRLTLTAAGRNLMMKVRPAMSQVAKVVGGNLSQAEKEALVVLLRKLHVFHNHIFLTERDRSVAALVEQLAPAKK
ncbi:MarR family winged helix-turn-helix transcriptional regulator [Spirosoma sp. 209]|uniref:MarR family winged helix-turn-helix transcriptional regulator n=1 Tax=Spirosoma sp. 209 TaxID=1955701 RepID=UPI00137482FD|nr:MarR family winged helix-turn-helix transcriptional regulator [Spirosoma sp. 209]